MSLVVCFGMKIELSSGNRYHMSHKAENIYCISPYKETWWIIIVLTLKYKDFGDYLLL